MNFRLAQANFSRGELAPQLYGRFDVDAYQSAVKLARNVMVLKFGGMAKRPGTFLVDEVHGDGPHRLVSFQFSLAQAYALEFGDDYMSPCVEGGRVVGAVTVSPYAGADLAEIDLEQTADTMYIAHLFYAPTKLLRHSHTSWEFVSVTFGPTIAAPTSCLAVATINNTDAANGGNSYFNQNATYVITAVNDDTGQESRASNESTANNDLSLKRNYNTITWAAVTGANRYNVYKADNSQFFGYIGTTEDLVLRDDNIGPALDQAPPQAYNPFPGAGDYPSTVTLFEQRSFWGRTGNAPHGIWGSRTAQLENMDRSRPLRADDSLSLTIVSTRVNAVNQLVPTASLFALTSDGVFTVDGDGNGGLIEGSSPPAARKQTGRGAARLDPLAIDNVVFYTPATGSAVRSINYSFEISGFKSNDVSIFSPHLFDGFSIVSWCYAQEPRSIIWAARNDGALLCFTWEQEQNVWGWTVCPTDGLVKSVCSISEGGEDRLYLIVERSTGTFVERMAPHFWDDVTDSCYMDCAITAEFGSPQSTFTGLDHLEGRTDVVGLIDGAAVTGLTVSGGSVTLPGGITGRKVTFGLPYQVDVETLPVRLTQQGTGSNLGRRQQIGDIVLELADSRSVLAGIDADHLYPVKSRTGEAYGSPDDLMNGTYVVSSDNKAGDNAGVYIRQTAPLPFTLLAVGADPIIAS